MKVTTPVRVVKPVLHLPAVRGVIERRMLLNFRCDPDTLKRLLPQPFRLKLVHGWGMAGISLVRLREIRPFFLPAPTGFRSENAAHRIAVEWEQDDKSCEGVFIIRRDTDSVLNHLAGGRIFPGNHHRATIRVWESGQRFKLEFESSDGSTSCQVQARMANALPAGSTFDSLAEASEFFRNGSCCWSPRRTEDGFDGLELRCADWQIESLAVEYCQSSFFQNAAMFPPGSAQFDSAFLMRDVPHQWHGLGRISVPKNKVAT